MQRHYLAYGSNLHPLRLQERVPSSRLLGRLSLPGYRLAFHKLGQDGSGKCNIIDTGRNSDQVHAALFSLAAAEKPLLDGFEGAGYGVEEMEIRWQGQVLRPFVYIAETGFIDDSLHPYHWYKQIVSLGARHLGLPAGYVQMIDSHVATEDPDEIRALRHSTLIERMQSWPELKGFINI